MAVPADHRRSRGPLPGVAAIRTPWQSPTPGIPGSSWLRSATPRTAWAAHSASSGSTPQMARSPRGAAARSRPPPRVRECLPRPLAARTNDPAPAPPVSAEPGEQCGVRRKRGERVDRAPRAATGDGRPYILESPRRHPYLSALIEEFVKSFTSSFAQERGPAAGRGTAAKAAFGAARRFRGGRSPVDRTSA